MIITIPTLIGVGIGWLVVCLLIMVYENSHGAVVYSGYCLDNAIDIHIEILSDLKSGYYPIQDALKWVSAHRMVGTLPLIKNIIENHPNAQTVRCAVEAYDKIKGA